MAGSKDVLARPLALFYFGAMFTLSSQAHLDVSTLHEKRWEISSSMSMLQSKGSHRRPIETRVSHSAEIVFVMLGPSGFLCLARKPTLQDRHGNDTIASLLAAPFCETTTVLGTWWSAFLPFLVPAQVPLEDWLGGGKVDARCISHSHRFLSS